MDQKMQKKYFDNLRSLALVDEEGDLIETADLSKFNRPQGALGRELKNSFFGPQEVSH